MSGSGPTIRWLGTWCRLPVMHASLVALFVAAIFAPSVGLAQAKTCGPGAEEISRSDVNGTTTLRCRCAKGFKPNAGRCEASPLVERMYPPMTTFVVRAVKVHGEAWVTLRDGRRINARDIAGTAIDNGAIVTAGPNSKATLYLPGDMAVTLYGGGSAVIEKFLYDPDAIRADSFAIKLLMGAIDLVEKPYWDKVRADRANFESQVKRGVIKLPLGTIGIRGTDVGATVAPNGASTIKLRSGLADFTPSGQSQAITLHPGQMITVSPSGQLSGPEAIHE